MLTDLRAENSPLIVLELGDFLEADPDKGKIVNPFIVENMVADGMLAMIPGIRELSAWHEFQALLAETPITLISSNLQVQTPTGFEPVGKRTHIIEISGVKIGLIGIMAQEQYDEVKPPEGVAFAIQDPGTVIEELAPVLRETVDLVVVLACMKDNPATALAQSLTDIDVLLGGHFSIASERPLLKGDVIVSRCGLRGQYFATTRLIVSPEGKILDWFGYNHPLAVDEYEPDTTLAAKVEEVLKAARTARLDGIRNRRTELPQSRPVTPRPLSSDQSAPAGGQNTGNSGVSLEGTNRFVTSFYRFDDSDYLGAQKCRRCHPAQYQQWERTDHAKAFALNAKADYQSDQDLLARIVTGYGHANGYSLDRSNPDLTGVQCEACHGPGSEHQRGETVAAIQPGTCLGCHGATASGWDYPAALAQVMH